MIYDVKSPLFRRFLAKRGPYSGNGIGVGTPLQMIAETLGGSRATTGPVGGFHSA